MLAGAAMVVNYPSLAPGFGNRGDWPERRERYDETVARLDEWLDAARDYRYAVEAGAGVRRDLELEAAAKILDGGMPVLLAADGERDIRNAVEWARGRGLDVGPLQRQGRVVVEQPAVEPVDGLDTDQTALGHPPEQRGGQVGEAVRGTPRLLQHPGEHVAGQQAHVVGEHAEDEPVDEVRHPVRVVAAVTQRLGER